MANPTLTGDLRRGDETQVLLKLQQAGVEPDDYAALAWDKEMRAVVVAEIINRRLFVRPEKQPEVLLTINEQVWKDSAVTMESIKALGDPPERPGSDDTHLYCITLLHDTGDALKTLERNWAACVYVQGVERTWKWTGLLFVPKGVRPRANAKPRKPGLRWAICELGRAYKGQSVDNVRPDLDRRETMGIGQELPAIGAMHPRWARAMNGDTIPYVDAPDLEVAPNAKGKFSCAPYLGFSRDNGTVNLNARNVKNPNPQFGSGSLP